MMLDTIALTLDQHQFEVLEPDRFSPSARGLIGVPYYYLGARGYFGCVLNPTKSDLGAGGYQPRLTLAKRKTQAGFALTLRIEFSAPKLIFGNNFDELQSRDFEAVLGALHESLTKLGIRVTDPVLRAARVSTIHYSKNMAFTDYTTCAMVIGELDLIDLSGRLDLSHTDYRNEGHAIRYHANSFELTFYDKIKDLQKARFSEKRAVESDNVIQVDLFRERSVFPKQLEVLRMEVRLGSRARIVKLLKQIDVAVEPTFAALFDQSIAKDVLLHFWGSVRRQLPLVGRVRHRRPEDVYSSLAVATKGKAKPAKLLQLLGSTMLLGSVGFRGTAALVSRHSSPRSWQRYKKELKALPALDLGAFGALGHVDKVLTQFEALRLDNFRASDIPCNLERSQVEGTRALPATTAPHRSPRQRKVSGEDRVVSADARAPRTRRTKE